MEFLKRNLTQMQAVLADMSFATKWLIGSFVVILILVGAMLVWWGGSADMLPVEGLTSGTITESAASLSAEGIDARVQDGQLLVPPNQLEQAVAALSRSGQLSPNAAAAFDQIMNQREGGRWMLSSVEKDREFLMAKSRFLGAVISSFPNVESASVILDKPEANGFGVTHEDPSASVMVAMQPGSRVNRQMADTLIHMVSSAVSGLDETGVTISDTSNSRSFTAADEDEIDNLHNIEATLASERLHTQRIEEVLSSWDGVMVAVKIVTSQVQREEVRSTEYQESQPLTLEETEERIQRNVRDGGSPGVQANVGTSIEGSGGSGTELTENRTTTSFAPSQPTRTTVQRIAGNMIRRINVSVVVPRSYYVRVFQAQNPEAEGQPSDEDLQPLIDSGEATIQQIVSPLIVSSEEDMQPGDISVVMAYDQGYLEPSVAGVSGGLGAVMSPGTIQIGMVGGLAALSLGMMMFMIRRATRKEDLPTIEELAGVPPTLPTDDDLMGEVDEIDTGLAGVELDEEELRARQIAEQISDLVRSNPEEAGGLLTKWVVDDHG